MKENLEGKITFSRPSGRDCDYINIELTDTKSGCILIEIRVPYAEFAQAITGLGHQPCNYDFYDSCPVGMVREVKTELVTKIGGYQRDLVKGKEAILPFEIDGWVGRVDDMFNHHRNKGEKQEVTFIRYVQEPSL